VRTLLREPLVHFLVAGALIFAAYAVFDEREAAGPAPEAVRLGEGDLTWIRTTWSRQWRREPTPEEMRQLVIAFLKEDLFAREARALGLDADDTVIRRRLAQKLEFLVRDVAQIADPGEEGLRRFHAEQRDLFRAPSRHSFRHVYFAASRPDPEAAARAALDGLAGADPGEIGDPFLNGYDFRGLEPQAVSALFGDAFSDSLAELPLGTWSGPVVSGYGVHLVLVEEREEGGALPFETVREQVLQRWREKRADEEYERYFSSLLAKYRVDPDALVGPDGPAAATPDGSAAARTR